MDHDDKKIFMDALENLPANLMNLKYGSNPKRKVERKKRAKNGFDSVVDLHGRTREEACIILRAVLNASAGKKRRILVITGKGLHSKSGKSILAETVSGFLVKEGAAYIAEWSTASKKNGGDGAFEVFTK